MVEMATRQLLNKESHLSELEVERNETVVFVKAAEGTATKRWKNVWNVLLGFSPMQTFSLNLGHISRKAIKVLLFFKGGK